MPRPLMQHGVGQLEEMFAKGRADPEVLKQLENELQYRQVPRAVALLAEIQAAMGGATHMAPPVVPVQPPKPETPLATQTDMWSGPPVVPAMPTPIVVPSRPAAGLATQAATVASPKPPPPTEAIPVELAYKLLKVTPASTWESIEQTRQQLVRQSHPARTRGLSPALRAQALAEAKRVNGAYLALSQLRCGGRKTL